MIKIFGKPWFRTAPGAFICNYRLAREVYIHEKNTLPKSKRRKFRDILDFYN